MALAVFCLCGCGDDGDITDPDDNGDDVSYRSEMRDFVEGISASSKSTNPAFVVIPQNGNELFTSDGNDDGPVVADYLAAIDGIGREDLLYGYDTDNGPTPVSERDWMIAFLDIAENNGVEALVTDYCWSQSFVNDSYTQNGSKGYISFAADHRELDNVPVYPAAPHNENAFDISSLSDAQNFLYLINSGQFGSKADLLSTIAATNYDLIIIDLFHSGMALTPTEITALKSKNNGGSRLVIAYMSIGEAEDYRYYWQPGWQPGNPTWLRRENPEWPGNFKVRYWEKEWQDIIYGNDSSYLKKILDAGFDGVYLDLIEAYEHFED